MYRKKITLTLFALLITIFGPAKILAQETPKVSFGSFYSSFGFGAPVDITSPNTSGIGLSGVSTYLGYSPNISNPGQWGLLGFTQGTISAGLLRYDAADNFATATNSQFSIDQFQIVVPVVRNRMGVSVAFTPMYRSDFRQRDEGSFNPLPDVSANRFDTGTGFNVDIPEFENESVDFLVSTVGSGGVNRFEAGLGFRVFDNVSIGYGMTVNLLTLNNNVISDFSDQQFRVTQYNRSTDGSSIGHRFGIYAYKGQLFGSSDQLSFGATVTLPTTIIADRAISTFRIINNQRVLLRLDQDETDRDGTIKLPLEFNTGLTYNFNSTTNVVAELMLQRWEDAEYSFNANQQGYFKNRVKTGIGFQHHPYRSDSQGGFFSNFKYSLGVSYDTGHLNIHGHDIETIFFNAGLGLMSWRSSSSVDLSFHYGIRGTQSSNLVKENIWGATLSLNLAEFMFVRQRFQ
ncbi:MAG: hypothetical protein EA391_01775 [Balneolaceae bacterium]|nr:MAG: hypothetical protein EA391_01775 [Balneolaceae bacterium]